jgi:hypothetical protein
LLIELRQFDLTRTCKKTNEAHEGFIRLLEEQHELPSIYAEDLALGAASWPTRHDESESAMLPQLNAFCRYVASKPRP